MEKFIQMTSQRSVTFAQFAIINEHLLPIATVQDRIPLGFALAYLFPPNQPQVKRGAVSTSAPVLHKDVEPGWATVSTNKGAMDRLTHAAQRLADLDKLLAEVDNELRPALIGKHPNDFNWSNGTLTVFGVDFELRGSNHVELFHQRTAARDGEVVVLTTKYFAHTYRRD